MGRHPKGIRRETTGWRVYVRVRGQYASQMFPLDTDLRIMQAWRDRKRLALGGFMDEPPSPPAVPLFREDGDRYLKLVTALTTYAEREQHILEWVAVFGDRTRASLTPGDIRGQRDRWLTVGPRREWKRMGGKYGWYVVNKPLAPSSVNHRLRALENLWTVLDGRHAYNPVREVAEAVEPDAPPRAIPVPIVRAILDAMRDTPTRARLAVIAWTGLPPKAIASLKPEYFNAAEKTLWVPGRQKGKGTKGRMLPLTADGVKALRSLASHDAWGDFSRSSVYKSFQRACAAVGVSGLRPYDLRHTYGTELLAATGDLRATQLLLGHSTGKLTERYGRQAVAPALVLAAQKLQKKLRAPKQRHK